MEIWTYIVQNNIYIQMSYRKAKKMCIFILTVTQDVVRNATMQDENMQGTLI